MKKFLTVLLALSVVFTYTVGTAFALPSDDTDVAGLKTAKAEAVETLESYLDDITDYTEVGQKLIGAKVLEGKLDVEKQTTIAGVTTVLGNYTNTLDTLVLNYSKKSVEDARDKAIMQVKDYLSLFGYKESKVGDATIFEAIEDGNLRLDGLELTEKDTNAFIAEWNNTYGALKTTVSSVEDVVKNLDQVLVVIDKYMDKLFTVAIPKEKVENLVEEILAVADAKAVTSANYSATIIAKYDATVKNAVAAAKAVKTYKDYYAVIDQYLGTLYRQPIKGKVKAVAYDGAEIHPLQIDYGWVAVLDEKVYIGEVNEGELFQLINMKKPVENQIKAAKKVLEALGDYNYKTIAEKKWADAEEFRLSLAEFIESGDVTDMPTGLASDIAKAAAGKDSDITKAVKAALERYEGYTKLAAYKADMADVVADYYGVEYNGKLATAADYTDIDVTRQIANLKELYTNKILAAKDTATVDSYVKACKEDIAKQLTDKELEIANEADDVIASIDRVVEATIGETSLTDEQEVLIDRIVSDLKARVKSGEDFPFTWGEDQSDAFKDAFIANDFNKVIGAKGLSYNTIKNVVNAIVNNTKDYNSTTLYGYEIAIDDEIGYANYTREDYGDKIGDISSNKGILATYAAQVGTWEAYFDKYDDYVKLCDGVPTAAKILYTDAVKDAENAITALGKVEYTKAFKAKLDDAAEKVDLVKTHDYKIADVNDISNYATYKDAAYEYAYLAYLAGLEKEISIIPVVNAFNEIARGITTASVIGLYSDADQDKILKIVTDAFDAIKSATTDEAKATIAEKAIADLRAIETVPTGNAADYAEALAANKAEAVKYFTKYENADFASDATTATQLIKDIVAFNAQFSDAAKLAKEQLIKDIKGTHMKIGSSAAKGYIRISWKQSNSTVALDGVKVYRSTKKTSGFKLISTFKKQTAKKYTANLKKGTKYYYKVKGYKVIDGVTYYTHESITVGRTFR